MKSSPSAPPSAASIPPISGATIGSTRSANESPAWRGAKTDSKKNRRARPRLEPRWSREAPHPARIAPQRRSARRRDRPPRKPRRTRRSVAGGGRTAGDGRAARSNARSSRGCAISTRASTRWRAASTANPNGGASRTRAGRTAAPRSAADRTSALRSAQEAAAQITRRRSELDARAASADRAPRPRAEAIPPRRLASSRCAKRSPR